MISSEHCSRLLQNVMTKYWTCLKTMLRPSLESLLQLSAFHFKVTFIFSTQKFKNLTFHQNYKTFLLQQWIIVFWALKFCQQSCFVSLIRAYRVQHWKGKQNKILKKCFWKKQQCYWTFYVSKIEIVFISLKNDKLKELMPLNAMTLMYEIQIHFQWWHLYYIIVQKRAATVTFKRINGLFTRGLYFALS